MANLGIAGFEIYFEDLKPEVQEKLLAYVRPTDEERDAINEKPIVIIE